MLLFDRHMNWMLLDHLLEHTSDHKTTLYETVTQMCRAW